MLECRAIRPNEFTEAARLVLSVALGADPTEEDVKRFFANAEATQTDLSAQMVALADDKPVGVLMFFPSGDGSANLSVPALAPDAPEETASLLIRQVVLAASEWDIEMLQFVAQTDSESEARPFTKAGFELTAKLVFMERRPEADDTSMNLSEELQFDTFCPDCPETEERFRRTVLRTFEGTTDCRNLKRTERMDRDILVGYRRKDDFDPSLWWLVTAGGEPAGCLLLNRLAHERCFEISYIAVVPEHRGKGFGEQLVRKAIAECAKLRLDWPLTLAVDTENSYALNIYHRLGFERTCVKSVYFKLPAR